MIRKRISAVFSIQYFMNRLKNEINKSKLYIFATNDVFDINYEI